MFELTHRLEFSAAHRLHAESLSDEENARLYGPCNRLHGHNYVLDVTVRGPIDPTTGMVMDLNVLAGLMRARVFDELDHRNLEQDVPWLAGTITTAENVAAVIWERLAPELEGRLQRVRLFESASNFVEYYGP
ncbi:MAG: 6-carboxytetrahydropterin synthase [Planctomycetota bacterium]|nr:MAG: 6-carboxytetrahydropterin synthase [Planctomycetota bacterium]